MTTQFLSRVDRDVKRDSNSNVGPGSYVPPSSLKKELPGFAPFSVTSSQIFLYNMLVSLKHSNGFVSSSERMINKDTEDSPAPGSYNISENLLKVCPSHE
jgi:hypothetical protein